LALDPQKEEIDYESALRVIGRHLDAEPSYNVSILEVDDGFTLRYQPTQHRFEDALFISAQPNYGISSFSKPLGGAAPNAITGTRACLLSLQRVTRNFSGPWVSCSIAMVPRV